MPPAKLARSVAAAVKAGTETGKSAFPAEPVPSGFSPHWSSSLTGSSFAFLAGYLRFCLLLCVMQGGCWGVAAAEKSVAVSLALWWHVAQVGHWCEEHLLPPVPVMAAY